MKRLAKNALIATGALKLLGRLREKGAGVLMYHSVPEDPNTVVNSLGGIAHSPQVFRGQMEVLARNFHPVTLDEVTRFVRGESNLPQRSVVVTFDDGYADNEEVALPILNEVGIPATFYITVDCVERSCLPWPSRLRYAFHSTKRTSWSDAEGKLWPLGERSQREQAFAASCDLCCKLAGDSQEKFVARVEQDLGAQLPNDSPRMMNWDQVRKLARQGHIVGSHTMTHPNVAQVPLETARVELAESRNHLEKRLGAKVVHFAYPCPALSPHWTKQTSEEARTIGYESAVTTDNGLAMPNDNPFSLKRVRPSKSIEGLRWNLETAFAGRAV